MNKRYVCLAALAAAPLLLSAAPALAKFRAGEYTLTFFSGPSHSNTGSQCLSFTKTGGVVGFTNSGTWFSPTFSGWGGNYVADGAYLRIYSTYGGGAGTINGYVKLSDGAGGFDDWSGATPPLTGANDGNVTLDPGCADVRKLPGHHTDPTR